MRILIPLLILLLVLILLAFGIGRYPVAPDLVLQVLGSQFLPISPDWPPEIEAVVIGIRLPRILAALLVGGALSVSGAAYQGLFRNPMVSPGLLGVSAGASAGAALAILLGLGMAGIQSLAFGFGLLAVMTTWLIASWVGRNGDPTLIIVLAGIIIGTLFTAGLSLLKFVADPYDSLPTITFWLMGSLAAVRDSDLAFGALPVLLGLGVLLSRAWTLNVLSFGDEEARALGVETRRLRLLVVLCSTLMTAAAVALAGVIGLVGLIVPHLARMLVGPDHRILLPVSAVLGAGFLLGVDTLARSTFSVEIPLGIVTSLLGAPFFLYLLNRSRKAWS